MYCLHKNTKGSTTIRSPFFLRRVFRARSETLSNHCFKTIAAVVSKKMADRCDGNMPRIKGSKSGFVNVSNVLTCDF